MYKGYKNHLLSKDKSNQTIYYSRYISKCPKCTKCNQIVISPVINNIHICIYCGNPFYVIQSK